MVLLNFYYPISQQLQTKLATGGMHTPTSIMGGNSHWMKMFLINKSSSHVVKLWCVEDSSVTAPDLTD